MEVALYHRGWWLLAPRGGRCRCHPWGRRGDDLVDQGSAHGELLVEFTGAPAPRTDDVFETDGLAREVLAHGPAEKALLMIDTDFGHVPGVIPDRDVFPDIGRQGRIEITQG